jgi:hypothetical protein
MPFAQKTRSRLSYIPETDYGETPPAGNFTELPYTGSTLNLTKERLQSETIFSDRMVRTDRHGNKSVTGDITFELGAGNFDDMLEAVMMSTWSGSDELKVGTLLRTFTFQDHLVDIDQARLFTGCGISGATFSFAPNTVINTTLNVVGSDSSVSEVERAVDPTTVNQPFDSYQGSLELGDVGGAFSGINCITSIELSINNGFEPAFVVGSDASQQLIYGDANIEGSITAYFEDLTLYNRFVTETEPALEIKVSDPGAANTYTFLLPRAKFNGAEAPVSGGNSRMLTIPFVGLRDTTEESPLVIYRPDSS